MTLRVATVPGDPGEEARLAAELSRHPGVELFMRCVDRVEVMALARAGSVDAIAMTGAPAWFDRELGHELARAGIRLVASAGDPLEAERLTLLGATLVARGVAVDDLVLACVSDVQPSIALDEPPRAGGGRLVAVWGPKGAPGRTTVAVELAYAFAERAPSTIVVDGDPYGGDVLQLLGVVEELPTVVWATRRAARGETANITGDLRRAGSSGPVLLPGLPRADLWADVGDYGWSELLETLRSAFEHVVVDVGFCLEAGDDAVAARGRNHMTRAAVRASDRVVAVFRADPVGVKNLLRELEHLEDLVGADRVVLLANRVRAGQEREIADLVRRHTGRRIVAYVPERLRDVARSVEFGKAIREVDPASDIARAVDVVAEALGARLPARGFLSRLAGTK